MTERRFLLRGEIDIAAAPKLRADLDAEVAPGGADLVVDCSELTFIDSSGLSVLLAVLRELQESGHALRLARTSNAIARVIQVAGLTETLGLDDPSGSSREATA
jgi:anti-anti-sigma factor